MQNYKADLFYKQELILGEGALWHSRWQQFLYVDIEGKKVGRIHPVTKIAEEVNVGKLVSAVAPTDGDELLVALQGSIAKLNFENGTIMELTDIESDKPGNRCNDGKCDALGRFWIGTMNLNAERKAGALYKLDGNSLTKMIEGTTVSNGLCWSADNKTMYYIDSFNYNIKAFDFDLEKGAISNGRIIVEIMAAGHVPDGMCIDAEGMLWVAIWGAGTVHRYNPENGMLLAKVLVDAPHVSNCAFGGSNMQQLLITTAREGLSAEQLEQYRLSGSLFIADVGVKGVAGFEFRG